MKLGDLLKRHYTVKLKDLQKQKKDATVYDMFSWKKVDVVMKNYLTGETIIDMVGLDFPEHFSQNACDIIASKYFRRTGVNTEDGKETSYRQVVHRMVSFWVASALDEKLITSEESAILYDELAYMMCAQMWAPNSPQWFNTGLNVAYGIKGEPQGHYYYDEKLGKVVESKDSYTRTQGSACFIIGVEDSLLGNKSITHQLETETRLFKFGSGVGTNWSNIRGEGEPLSGGGKSSGLMSFLNVFNANAGAIKSGGTTRRAAKMNVLDIDHPDIEKYIDWKAREEQKVRDLGKMGYDTHFDGEAYATVGGQNANNSVRVTNDYMKALEDNSNVGLTRRVDGEVVKEVNAKELWNRIAKAAWECGDPGLQYDTTINEWHTCPAGEDGKVGAKHNRINASNPCSEYMFLDDTACNLASINLMAFYDKENNLFDIDGYTHCISLCQIVLEATIHWGQFPTEEIARKSYMFRTTGLGYANLGALLMCMGYGYDTEEARQIGASLLSLLTGQSYLTSALMAKQVGAFKYFSLNRTHMLAVLENHKALASGQARLTKGLGYEPYDINKAILAKTPLKDIGLDLYNAWTDALKIGAEYGYRNAQVSVLAPTGTISFAMDCSTTSSEPFFGNMVWKKLVGGGGMSIVNDCIPYGLRTLGYSDEEIEDIIAYAEEYFGLIEGAPHIKDEHLQVFDTANKASGGERYIEPMGHVRMMAALTPQVSGAISKTVNMPNDATVEDIEEIYYQSWKMGVKAIALYRDGCKASQPLNMAGSEETRDKTYDELANTVEEFKGKLEELESLNKTYESENKDLEKQVKQLKDSSLKRVKPAGIRSANVHEVEMGGIKLYITVSRYADGAISEVYISAGRQGSLVKGLLDSISTTISEMIQYGVSPKDIAKMYRGQKFEPSGFVNGHPYIKMADSISDLISKVIDIELGDYTYCQVKPEPKESLAGNENDNSGLKDSTVSSLASKTAKNRTILIQDTVELDKDKANGVRLYGETCSNCGSDHLVKNGTCKVCRECGTTTGCS